MDDFLTEEEYQGRAWGDVTPYAYEDIDCPDECPGCTTNPELRKKCFLEE